jgi:hypothetical protein
MRLPSIFLGDSWTGGLLRAAYYRGGPPAHLRDNLQRQPCQFCAREHPLFAPRCSGGIRPSASEVQGRQRSARELETRPRDPSIIYISVTLVGMRRGRLVHSENRHFGSRDAITATDAVCDRSCNLGIQPVGTRRLAYVRHCSGNRGKRQEVRIQSVDDPRKTRNEGSAQNHRDRPRAWLPNCHYHAGRRCQ